MPSSSTWQPTLPPASSRPFFFIAGAIAVFVKKEAILKHFSTDAKMSLSYWIASISGIALAVCSCTMLPMFTGILKKGSGIDPATTFLYAGPAINILAIIYTASVLGWENGGARASFAIMMSIAIGLPSLSLCGGTMDPVSETPL